MDQGPLVRRNRRGEFRIGAATNNPLIVAYMAPETAAAVSPKTARAMAMVDAAPAAAPSPAGRTSGEKARIRSEQLRKKQERSRMASNKNARK